MSNLESQAQLILSPMIHGRTTPLSVEQQQLIVQWLVKTTMMFEFLIGKERRSKFFLPSERHAFMRSLSVPSGTLVFLANYRGKFQVLARDTRPTFVPDDPQRNLTERLEAKAYGVTFAIKHLALQFIAVREPAGVSNSTVLIPGEWDNAEIRIWPSMSDVRWPPPQYFDDDGLDMFISRWRQSPV